VRFRWVFVAALVLAAVPAPSPAQDATGLLPEPALVARAIDFATRTMGDGSGEKSGVFVEMGHMVTGAGWISAGPGYRQWFGGDRMVAEASAAMSWRSYKMARARVEITNLARSRVAVGAEARWQDFTQNTHFGDGATSVETDRGEYRLKAFNAIGYTNIRPVKWLTIGGRAGWLRRPALSAPGGTFQRNYPAMQDVFPGDAAFALARQPQYFHGEASVTADTRDHRSHALRGGLYRGAWTRYADRDSGAFSFQRFEGEAAHFVPVARSRVTLALHGWLVASDTAAGGAVPFYLMPSLGGNNTLRAYANYRFHDRHFVVANAEARIALFEHVDAALFADAGNVASRLADLNLGKRSFGVGLRLHSLRSTFARLDLAHGAEGWRVLLSTSDPLHLSRLSRRTAPIPFAP
jgi:outer membrane protein assembly factor BamA